MKKGEFTIEEFMCQMKQGTRYRPMSKLMGIIPGMRRLTEQLNMSDEDTEDRISRMWAIYDSMNYKERDNPDILNGSRRRRVATGAGVRVTDVINFMKQFEMSREMMRLSR